MGLETQTSKLQSPQRQQEVLLRLGSVSAQVVILDFISNGSDVGTIRKSSCSQCISNTRLKIFQRLTPSIIISGSVVDSGDASLVAAGVVEKGFHDVRLYAQFVKPG